MRSKLLGLLVVLALLLGTFGTALAQDTMEPFCGDLAAKDCTLLQDSQAAMMDVSSYKASATYDAMLAGIPGLPVDEINVNVSVDGAFAMDDAALAASKSFVGLDQQSIMAALAKDPQPIVDLLNGADFDLTLNYQMTKELAALFGAQAGVDVPADGSVGLRMVDGVLYADLSDFAALGAPAGWIGVPVGELLQAQVDADVFKEAMAQMDPSKMDPTTAATLGLQNMIMGNAKEFEKYMMVERGDDIKVADGQAAAVFNTTVNVAGLVAGPEFAQLINTLADSGAFESSGLSAADVKQNLPMLGMMAPMIFADLKVGNSTTIGTKDMFVYNAATEFSWDLTGLLKMAAMSGALPAGLDASKPMSISFTTNLDYSDFNTAQTVEAPADAMMIPVESMMGEPAK